MSFRNRTTRFTPKPKPPTDSISVISQVVAPTPTPTTRVTRFTPTPTPPRPRPTITTVTTPTPRPTVTTTRITRFTPTPRPPPRDDFQRSLSVFPVVREAFAETPPRQVAQIIPVEREVGVERPRVRARAGFRRPPIVPVRAIRKDDISMVATPPFQLTEEQRIDIRSQPKVPLKVQQAEVKRLRDLGVPTFEEAQREEGLSDFERAFASFGGGVTQEVLNIGAIAGVSTFREEAGSLAIDLPFAVLGETFTRPSEEQTGGVFGGGGFGGLGFDFRESPDFEAGFERSGEIQQKISDKFAEDPARALGSVFAVATIETAIFVGTGGAGRLALQGAKKFAQTKGRGIAEKVRQKFAEKGVGGAIENLGTNEFLITQGVSASAKRGIVLGKLDAVAIGLKKGINPITASFKQISKNIILTKTPTLRGVTKGGKKGKIKSKDVGKFIDESKEAEIPLIHVRTNVKIAGIKKKQTVVTLFTKKQIRESGFPTDATIRGVTDPKLLKRLGLEAVGEKATTAQGKLRGGAVRQLIIAEESGAIRLVGEGTQFLAKDIFANPKTLRQIALTGRTLGGQMATLSKTQIFEAQALGGAKFVKEAGKGIGNVGVSFGSKAEARELSRLGLGDVARLPKSQGGKPFSFAKVDEIGDLGKVFGEAGSVGKKVKDVGKGAQQTARPTQATDDIANIFRQVSKETRTPARSIFTPTGVGTAVGIRTGLRTDFQNIFSPRVREPRVREDTGLDLGVISDVRIGEGFRLQEDIGAVVPIPRQQRVVQTVIPEQEVFRTPEFFVGQEIIPEIGLGFVPIFDQGTGFTPITDPIIDRPRKTPTGLGGGLPSPFLFSEADRRRERRRRAKRKSRLGGRLFDIADEPFGEVAVGLGFFVETERGETSIEEALGIGEFDDEPVITRQEKQARARLKGRKRRDNIDDIFDVGGLFG